MDSSFVQTVERALDFQGREISVQGQRIVELARLILDNSRRVGAAERLAMVACAMLVSRASDPLQAMEELRTAALDAIPVDDEGSTDAMREPLERAIAKIEAAVLPPR